MDYEEIDAWYEEQKQRLLNEYIEGLEQGKDRKQLQADFEKRMKQLHQQYEKLSIKSLKQKKLKKGISKLTKFMDKIIFKY